ncbi:MAG TPA: PIN domain-containing protein, partial [Ktedonobacterales bacterium]|nr:PIN domain-containing protein [Ktedonobacterales bacterium]
MFVDTSAYYALADARDNNHAVALTTAQQINREGNTLLTSNFVVAETHTLLLNRLGRDITERMLDRLYASATQIVRAYERDETRAREIIHQRHDRKFSLVDAISFASMER